jgi:hypothetical protein
MLTIATLAYAGMPVEAPRVQGTPAERRQHLFVAYVDRIFKRRSAITRYTRQQTERWLAWLAWQLTRHSQTIFSLERMQPDWLPQGQHWVPTHGASVVAGLGGALVFALGLGLGGEPDVELGGGLGFGLIGALIGGLTGYAAEITSIEMVRWSWSRLLAELFLPSRHGLRGGLVVGLGGALGGGLVFGLGLRLSHGLLVELPFGLPAGLGVGLGIGLATGLRYGGRACLQHLVLRLALRYHGSIARHYVDFLDYAAERLFLRKVGGGYIFLHRLLQDYFAARYSESGDRVTQEPIERGSSTPS